MTVRNPTGTSITGVINKIDENVRKAERRNVDFKKPKYIRLRTDDDSVSVIMSIVDDFTVRNSYEITSHPLARSGFVSDHKIKRQMEVMFSGSLLTTSTVTGGINTMTERVGDEDIKDWYTKYSNVKKIADGDRFVVVTTPWEQYRNLQISDFEIRKNYRIGNGCIFDISLIQIQTSEILRGQKVLSSDVVEAGKPVNNRKGESRGNVSLSEKEIDFDFSDSPMTITG